jgi:3-oxoacyl-[acyl-carrier protein] reductase
MYNYDDLQEKVAIVTGGGRGIGQAICLKLAGEGVYVVVNDIVSEEKVSPLIARLKDLSSKALFVPADISKIKEVKEMVKKVINEFGYIDILVNNAGITRDGLLLRMKEKDWDDVIAVNLKGTFNCIQAAAKYMMKQRSGAIVNISSVVGVYGNAGQANYSASKAGIIGLTKTAAKELGKRGIRVNAIAPGFIETEMTKRLSEETRAKVIERIPLGGFGSPDDVASLVCFLVSEEAGYITGQVIGLDGGLVI